MRKLYEWLTKNIREWKESRPKDTKLWTEIRCTHYLRDVDVEWDNFINEVLDKVEPLEDTELMRWVQIDKWELRLTNPDRHDYLISRPIISIWIPDRFWSYGIRSSVYKGGRPTCKTIYRLALFENRIHQYLSRKDMEDARARLNGI